MKKLYSLLVMMLLGVAAATAATSTLTFTEACKGTGTADDGAVWTVTSDAAESVYNSAMGVHYGTNKLSVQYIKLTTSDIAGTITEVVVNASDAQKVATVSVTVGGAAFGDAQTERHYNTESGTDFTFSGSASGEIVVSVDRGSAKTKALYVKSVAVTYTTGGGETVTIAKPVIEGVTPFEDETLVAIGCETEGAKIYYTLDGSTPTAESTLYSEAFTITESCTVKAIATDGTNFSAVASMNFVKTVAYTSLAQVNALTDNTDFTFSGTTVVLGKKNKNMYIVDADNAAGTLVYGSSNFDDTFVFGAEIAAGWSGNKTTYNTKPEVQSPANMSLSGNTVTLTPIEISKSDLTLANFGRYAVLKNATSNGSAISDSDGNSIYTYNQFDVAVPAEGTYDIYGVIGWNNNSGQFMILKAEAVDTPEPETYTITIDKDIVNGTVVADKAEAAEGETVTLTATPNDGYELKEYLIVADNDADVTVTDNTFVMPASNVTVMAEFQEVTTPEPDEGGTGTITFGKDDVKINAAEVTGDDTLGNTWTITTEGTTSFTSATGYYQVGSSKSAATSITFTTTLPNEVTVTEMSAKFGGFSGTQGTVTLKVGDTTVGTGSFETDDATISSTETATGKVLTVTVTDIAKGVKCYNISYTYTTGEVTMYTVTIDEDIVNGTVTADKAEAAEGSTVTLTVTPDEGYELKEILVIADNDADVTVTDNKFVMPASNVTVMAEFQEVVVPDGETGTITFGKDDVKINAAEVTGDDTLGNTWTITTEGTTSFTSATGYYQVGSSKSAATSITFTTTLPNEVTVTEMSAKFGGFSGTQGTVTLKVGDTTVGTGSFETDDATISSTETATGKVLTVTVTDIAKGVKCYYISYTYAAEQPVEGVTLEEALAGEAGEVTITSDMAVVTAVDDYAIVSDGNGNWLKVTGLELAKDDVIKNLVGEITLGTNPVIAATASDESDANLAVAPTKVDIAKESDGSAASTLSALKANEVITVKGYYFAADSKLKAFSGGHGINIDVTTGHIGALENGKQYEVTGTVNFKEAEAGAPARIARAAADGSDITLDITEGALPTGVATIKAVDGKEIQGIYNLNGQKVTGADNGVYVIRYTDGTAAKVRF